MEHPKFKETLDQVMESVTADAEKIEPTINIKLQSSVQNCMNKSSNNPDRFASCMLDTQKRVSELTESFQFKNLFLANIIQNCLSNNTDSNKCVDEGKKMANNIISDFLKQVEKI
jgi:hypothetical protein